VSEKERKKRHYLSVFNYISDIEVGIRHKLFLLVVLVRVFETSWRLKVAGAEHTEECDDQHHNHCNVHLCYVACAEKRVLQLKGRMRSLTLRDKIPPTS